MPQIVKPEPRPVGAECLSQGHYGLCPSRPSASLRTPLTGTFRGKNRHLPEGRRERTGIKGGRYCMEGMNL